MCVRVYVFYLMCLCGLSAIDCVMMYGVCLLVCVCVCLCACVCV